MVLSAVIVVIITIFLPPVGVLLVAGCGADFLINLLLTCLGYFPGHIHAFYLEYQYYHRKSLAREGLPVPAHASGIFSSKVQMAGQTGVQSYGTVPVNNGYNTVPNTY